MIMFDATDDEIRIIDNIAANSSISLFFVFPHTLTTHEGNESKKNSSAISTIIRKRCAVVSYQMMAVESDD